MVTVIGADAFVGVASDRFEAPPFASATLARYGMRQFKRSERLGVQMQRDIAQLLETELADRVPGMVTFTHVKLSDDLRHARVYYSYLGQESDRPLIEEYLLRERGRLRSLVGRNLRIRNIPELDFKYDPSVERGARIEQLLEDIKRDQSDRPND